MRISGALAERERSRPRGRRVRDREHRRRSHPAGRDRRGRTELRRCL